MVANHSLHVHCISIGQVNKMESDAKKFTIDDSLLFSQEQLQEALDNPHGMWLTVIDLESLAMERQRSGEKFMAGAYLSPIEQQQFTGYSYEKRKNEWLGGRVAAKIVVARCMAENNTGAETAVAWQDIIVRNKDSGRPYCTVDRKEQLSLACPDISISHCNEMAAAMAVNKGKCGIDIQQATLKTVKVKKRFCSQEEFDIMQGVLPDANEAMLLTPLWSAKEALRKAADKSPVPGFQELQLMEIYTVSQGLWHLSLTCPAIEAGRLRVAVGQVDDYFLAVTVASDRTV